jgi:glycosyltransferase involved in cell wall biosynthesis
MDKFHMKNPGLSVIITFYNEVEFIDLALTSIITQNVADLEVIIINDNPSNFTDAFFDDAGYSKNARIIHHTINKGLSAARNTGITAAQGDYIAFLDADDYYRPGGLKKHYTFARDSGADLTHAHTIITPINRTLGNVMWSDILMPDTVILKGEARLTGAFERVNSWASIYKRAFLIEKGVLFDTAQRKFEDRLFIVQSMIASDTVAIFAEPVRIWRRRANSITTSKKSLTESRMKLALFEKCVWSWRDSSVENKRNFQCTEFVRHALTIVFQDHISEWIHLNNSDFPEESKALRARLQTFVAGTEITRDEVKQSFTAQNHRYAEFKSGSGKITADDLYRYITAIAEDDSETLRVITDKARLKKPKLLSLHAIAEGSERATENLKIYVHFGTHKTGSTFVQQQLAANYDALKAYGILFPKTGLGFPHDRGPVRASGLPGHQGLITATNKINTVVLEALQAEIADSGCKKIIISAENLCTYAPLKPGVNSATIARNLSQLGLQGDFTPVIYFRRPDRWIDSFYREQVSNGALVAHQHPDEYFNNQQNRLHYAETVHTIEEALGQEASIANFDAVVRGEGLLESFLRLCDSPDMMEHITISDAASRYESPCNAQIKMSRLIASLIPDELLRADILRDFYALTDPTDQRNNLMSVANQTRAIEIFKDTSAAFFQERGIDMNEDSWKVSTPSDDIVVPNRYLEVLSQIGVTHRSGVNEEPLAPGLNIYDSDTLRDYPRPIRAFVRGYRKMTSNRVYTTLRRGFRTP